MKAKFLILLSLPALAACASTTSTRNTSLPAAPASPLQSVTGLEIVMGKTADQLIRLFGKPQLDISEPPAHKLQFASGACILDAYLYPSQDSKTSRVTHIDTRRSDGAAVDRVSCVNALRSR